MQNGFPEYVNEKDTPHLLDWIARINERPAVKKMFANGPGMDTAATSEPVKVAAEPA